MSHEFVASFAQVTIILLSFSLGLKAPIKNVGYLLKQPSLLLRSLFSVDILVPLLTLLIVFALPLPRLVRIGLLLMAISPGAPFIPLKSVKAGGKAVYVYQLQIVLTALAVLTTPVTLKLLAAPFDIRTDLNFWGIAKIMILAQLIPLFVGIGLQKIAPHITDQIEPWVARIANSMLILLALVVLVKGISVFRELDLSTYLAILLIATGALIAGHLLGGKEPGTRIGLALASATRHPGLALFLATQNFPAIKAAPVIVTYLIISTIVSFPYMRWCKKRSETFSKISATA